MPGEVKKGRTATATAALSKKVANDARGGLSTTPPALFIHCECVYNAMFDRAKTTEDGIVVYEGMLTKLVNDLNLSVPYFTSVRRSLMQMGCMRQLRRGGGSTPSQWELITLPTLEKFQSLDEGPRPKTRRATQVEQLEDQVAQLNRRLHIVEATLRGEHA